MKNNDTPDARFRLHRACGNGDLRTVGKLVANSAIPAADLAALDDHGNTPLMRAIGARSVVLIEFLVGRGADPCQACHEVHGACQSAWSAAIKSGSTEVVTLLHGLGAHQCEHRPCRLEPLGRVLSVGNLDMMEHLLHLGMEPNRPDASGHAPFHHAVLFNDARTVAMLQAHCARPLPPGSAAEGSRPGGAVETPGG